MGLIIISFLAFVSLGLPDRTHGRGVAWNSSVVWTACRCYWNLPRLRYWWLHAFQLFERRADASFRDREIVESKLRGHGKHFVCLCQYQFLVDFRHVCFNWRARRRRY